MKFVITGGPCSGKTSIILAIEQMVLNNPGKYHIMHETAEDLIKYYKSKGHKHPYKEIPTFQVEIARVQEQRERILSYLPEDTIIFFDRSIADTLAYETNPDYSKEILDAVKRAGYEKIVFFAEPIPELYEATAVRLENFNEAKELGKKVKKVYKDLGFKTVEIPPGSTEERAKKVLQLVEEYVKNRKPLKSR
jgi:predicted ATPase